jgi:mycoredoxin
MKQVIVFGTDWCAGTQMVRRYLDRLGIAYSYQDMDADPEAESRVRWWTGGDASHPTMLVGSDILIEPNLAEIQSALVKNGLA